MNREIKFRAWIEKDKTMFYQKDQYLISFLRRANQLFNPEDSGHDKYGSPPLMQFTDLKDKNNQEIYEGDILGYPRREDNLVEGGVVFNNGAFGIKTEMFKQILSFTEYIRIDDFNELEIIGNVYENPELI